MKFIRRLISLIIALAVIVENAGFGSASAAPIARRVFDYLLADEYPNPQDLEAVQKGQATRPIGTPLKASEVPWPSDGTPIPASPEAPSPPVGEASGAAKPVSPRPF